MKRLQSHYKHPLFNIAIDIILAIFAPAILILSVFYHAPNKTVAAIFAVMAAIALMRVVVNHVRGEYDN